MDKNPAAPAFKKLEAVWKDFNNHPDKQHLVNFKKELKNFENEINKILF